MAITLTFASAVAVFIPLLISMIYYFRKDTAEYAEFKAQSDTVQRQTFYRKWTIRSFAIYAVLTVVILTVFRRLNSMVLVPEEFSGLSALVRHNIFGGEGIFDTQMLFILVAVFVLSALISPTLIAYFGRQKAEPILVGDIEPLLPRNRSEQIWGTLISVNAGFSEELYFRLLLPLLLYYIFGTAMIAFSVSAVLFGLVHIYQGWVGMVFTTILGVVLSLLYLGTGMLWVVMVAHAVLNLNGLVLQPYLRSKLQRPTGDD